MVLHCWQGSGTGGAADTCLTAAESPEDPGADTPTPLREKEEPTAETRTESLSFQSNASVTISRTELATKIHRSESYRHIIEAAEDEGDEERNVFFFNRFKPTAKFVNIERIPRSRSVKM